MQQDSQITLTLVSPEKHVLTQKVDMVVIPGEEGDFGVLPRHSAMISTLRPGLITLYSGDEKKYVYVDHGFANVSEEYCIILSETCEFTADLNLSELEDLVQKLAEEIQMARTDQEKKELTLRHQSLLQKKEIIKHITA